MTLVLQTNIAGYLGVWLVRGQQVVAHRSVRVPEHGSERALALVDATLAQAQADIHAVSRIVVVRGPGPFTAVRTGLIIANTLGTLLNIPVHGVVTKHQLNNADVLRDVQVKLRQQELAASPGYGAERNPASVPPAGGTGARVKASLAKIVKPWYGKSPNISTPKNTSRNKTV